MKNVWDADYTESLSCVLMYCTQTGFSKLVQLAVAELYKFYLYLIYTCIKTTYPQEIISPPRQKLPELKTIITTEIRPVDCQTPSQAHCKEGRKNIKDHKQKETAVKHYSKISYGS